MKFLNFWVVGWNFASLFNVMGDSLLYFSSWNFIWFLHKEPTTVQIFRPLTAQVEFHQICTLIAYFCRKYIKFQLKKARRSYVSCYQRVLQNLEKNLSFVSQMTRIWWILIWALKILKNLLFDLSLLCKVCNVWPEKVQRSYISWHWRVMLNLKKNWHVVWKMTWIWEIFIRTLEGVKIGIVMGSFCPK